MAQPITGTLVEAYPQVDLPKKYGGGKATVIAWLWARTVPSPNPALVTLKTPLVRNFHLLDKEDRKIWVEPVANKDKTDYRFEVRHGIGPVRPPNIGRSGANCVVTGEAIPLSYIRQAAQSGMMGQRLMAVVVETSAGRNYISPTQEMEQIALHAEPVWRPETLIPLKHRNFQTPLYGMTRFGGGFHSEVQRLKRSGSRRLCQAPRGTPRPGTGIRGICAG